METESVQPGSRAGGAGRRSATPRPRSRSQGRRDGRRIQCQGRVRRSGVHSCCGQRDWGYGAGRCRLRRHGWGTGKAAGGRSVWLAGYRNGRGDGACGKCFHRRGNRDADRQLRQRSKAIHKVRDGLKQGFKHGHRFSERRNDCVHQTRRGFIGHSGNFGNGRCHSGNCACRDHVAEHRSLGNEEVRCTRQAADRGLNQPGGGSHRCGCGRGCR